MARKQTASTAQQDGIEFITNSAEETQQLGEQLGACLQAGDVVALDGELGSGKTTLTQGIAKGLGCNPDRVKSPTFVLVREYPGKTPLIHVDAYRLSGTPEAALLDVGLLFTQKSVTLIEWAKRLDSLLPPDHLLVQLHHLSTNRRKIIVTSCGGFSQERLNPVRTRQSQKPREDTHEAAGD